MPSRTTYWGIWVVLLVYVGLAVGYSLVTPPFEAPDEIHHYAFIRDLVRDRALPVQREDDPPSQRHQPPLYYVLGALATFWNQEPEGSPYSVARSNPHWGYAYGEVGRDNKNLYLHGDWDAFPYRGTALGIHLVRLLSVLIGAVSVYAGYHMGLELFPGRPALAVGGVAFMAFNPMFLFISGAVNNDNLIVLWVTLIVVLLMRVVRHGITLRRNVGIGVLCGLALLTKLTGLYALPVVAVGYLAAAWPRRDWGGFIRGGLVIAALTLLVSGWWFARNLILYGEPTSIRLTLQTWHARPEGLDWGTALFELPIAETSFWGRFGYGNVPVPNFIYQALGIISRLGALGAVALAYRLALRGRERPSGGLRAFTLLLAALAWAGVIYSYVTVTGFSMAQRTVLVVLSIALVVWLLIRRHLAGPMADDRVTVWPSLRLLGVLAFTVLAYFGAMFTYMLMSTTAANGRYMFPALPAVSLLIFTGLGYYAPRRWRPALAEICAAGMVLLSLTVLLFYLRPAYARPPVLPPDAVDVVPGNVGINFDDKALLLGTAVEPERCRPGEVLEMTLYWQALEDLTADYAVTVQAFGRDGTRIGQRDSFTGQGNYPTSEWSPGEVVVDTYRVPIDPAAEAPVAAEVEVGLYMPGSQERLPAFDDQHRPLGRTIVARFKLAPRRKPRYEWVNPVDYRLGERIVLRGYDVEGALRPGGAVRLTLYWEALDAVEQDYTVFVHLLDGAGRVRAQQDGQPVRGEYPTALWEEGELIEDRHEITLPADLPPGRYRAALGMYALETMQRLPVFDGEGVRQPEDRILLPLGQVR